MFRAIEILTLFRTIEIFTLFRAIELLTLSRWNYLKGSEGVVESSGENEERVEAGESHEEAVEAVADRYNKGFRCAVNFFCGIIWGTFPKWQTPTPFWEPLVPKKGDFLIPFFEQF